FMVTDKTMVYGRVSFIRGKFRINDNLVDAQGNALGNLSTNKSRNGWQLGVGVQTMLTQHISARLEYDYARYGRIKTASNIKFNNIYAASIGLPVITANGVVARTLSVRPTVNTVSLGLSYHFMAA
ncbi:unnamed protein product, partial [marine sediment metagenome]